MYGASEPPPHMSSTRPSKHAVLDALVTAHQMSDNGVSVTRLAGITDGSEEAVARQLRLLRDLELAACGESGYRPTVTGEELIDLGLDVDEIVVVDVVENQ
jgi:predicted transcriptional regulator